MAIYQYNCCCKASCIWLTTRHLSKRIKEYVPKNVENFCFSQKKDDTPTKVLNASKRSSVAEKLVNNLTCANSYNLNIFRLIKTFSNVFDLVKLKAICFLLKNSVLCKQKGFDYNVSIFSY